MMYIIQIPKLQDFGGIYNGFTLQVSLDYRKQIGNECTIL